MDQNHLSDFFTELRTKSLRISMDIWKKDSHVTNECLPPVESLCSKNTVSWSDFSCILIGWIIGKRR